MIDHGFRTRLFSHSVASIVWRSEIVMAFPLVRSYYTSDLTPIFDEVSYICPIEGKICWQMMIQRDNTVRSLPLIVVEIYVWYLRAIQLISMLLKVKYTAVTLNWMWHFDSTRCTRSVNVESWNNEIRWIPSNYNFYSPKLNYSLETFNLT